jgi:hypothetical protein
MTEAVGVWKSTRSGWVQAAVIRKAESVLLPMREGQGSVTMGLSARVIGAQVQ